MAIVSYQVEEWSRVLPDISAHWQAHFDEIALDADRVPLAPDFRGYAELERNGMLHVVTARCAGEVIGYVVAIVRPHLHYVTTLMALYDLYYLAPGHRSGWIGVRLLQEAERSLKKRGVKKLCGGTKLHNGRIGGRRQCVDTSSLFRWMGWREDERLMSKWIGTH